MTSRSQQILGSLPPELCTRLGVRLAAAPAATAAPGEGEAANGVAAPPVLPLGWGAVDALLPGGGLLRGGVVELAVQGSLALGTSLGLRACRAAQRQGVQPESAQHGSGRQGSSELAWCGFVDPSGTLHAPGVAGIGVSLERLLVVRPPLEVLSRVVLRMAESRAFSLLVVDTAGVPHQPLDVHLGPWVRVVRRLTLALQGTESTVVLLTDQAAPRPLVLPVAQRIELARRSEREFSLAVTRDPQGRLSPPRTVAVRSSLEAGASRSPGLSSGKPRTMAGAA